MVEGKVKNGASEANEIHIPEGWVLVGVEIQSLWAGRGIITSCICVRSGDKPIIDSPGNAYDGPRVWDIVRASDMGWIRFGLRTKSVERMARWLERRMPETPSYQIYGEISDAIDSRWERD